MCILIFFVVVRGRKPSTGERYSVEVLRQKEPVLFDQKPITVTGGRVDYNRVDWLTTFRISSFSVRRQLNRFTFSRKYVFDRLRAVVLTRRRTASFVHTTAIGTQGWQSSKPVTRSLFPVKQLFRSLAFGYAVFPPLKEKDTHNLQHYSHPPHYRTA